MYVIEMAPTELPLLNYIRVCTIQRHQTFELQPPPQVGVKTGQHEHILASPPLIHLHIARIKSPSGAYFYAFFVVIPKSTCINW